MFIRLTTAYVSIDHVDEANKILQEDIVPAVSKQKGFQQFVGVIDKKTGKGIAIELWDTDENANAIEQNGFYQEQLSKLASFFITTPVREGYEVTVQG